MSNLNLDPVIWEKLEKLNEKYQMTGQDMSSYLDGLLYADYLSYWDYIHLDTLLSLQNPKTTIPDEKIFIAYHQFTELFFGLALHELEQLAADKGQSDTMFLDKLKRIIRYFEQLVSSFDIMTDGMAKDQFMKFRMSLLPASGFQSAQYRLIEIASTDFHNLVDPSFRNTITKDSTLEEMYDKIYWKKGATEIASGNKTLTLVMFEKKYSKLILETAASYKEGNLWYLYNTYFKQSDLKTEIENALKYFDVLVNINWPLAHFKSAAKYLHNEPDVIAATGGTNWQKYLPPRFQRRIFFDQLWTEEEKENWGKKWVLKTVFKVD